MSNEADAGLAFEPIVRPFFADDAVTIYHGDCREIVPLLGRFDLMLTDPPYGIDAGNTAFGKAKSRNEDWDKTTQPEAIADAILHADNAIVWGGNYYHLAPSPCWLVWDKKNDCTTFADCELAWTNLKKAVRVFRWLWSGPYQEKRESREHPTQKPIELIKWCIEQAGDVQTILDPFAGSGTTGRAAKDLGKRAVLIEREERYCEIAARRLAQDVLPLDCPNKQLSD